jgi:hypothetical protein
VARADALKRAALNIAFDRATALRRTRVQLRRPILAACELIEERSLSS